MRMIVAILGLLAAGLAASAEPAVAQTSDVTIKVASFGGQFGNLEKVYAGDRFTRMTGIKVEWVSGEPVNFLAQMQAARGRLPPFDVVIMDETVRATAIEAGLLAKLDPALVPNLKQLYPDAVNAEGYGPDLLFYSVGLVFQKDKLKAAGIPEPTSWNDLWDPRLAGHISIPDISNPTGTDFAIKIAQIEGGSEKNLQPGLDRIAKLKATSYYTASAMLEALLASGDVWMSVFTSGRGWGMVDRGYPVGYIVPKEGSVAGVDTIDMVVGTTHPKEAQAFINMALDPVTQIGMALEMSYGPSNASLQGVMQAYPDAAKKMPATPADLAKLYHPDWTVYNANLKQTTEYWNRHVKQ